MHHIAEILPTLNPLCNIDRCRNSAIEQAYFRIVASFLELMNSFTDKPSQMAIQLDYRKQEKQGYRTLNKLMHILFTIELIEQGNGKLLIAYAMNDDVLELDTMPRFTAILRLIYSQTEDKHNQFTIEDCLQIDNYINDLSLTEGYWLFENPKARIDIHCTDHIIIH